MKLTMILLVLNFFQVTANSLAQKITIKKDNAKLIEIFSEIRKQAGYDFIYKDRLIKDCKPISVDLKQASIETSLKTILRDQPLSYTIKGTTIILKPKKAEIREVSLPTADNQQVRLNGKVIDENGSPISNATVLAKRNNVTVFTDSQGQFSIRITNMDDSIRFSFVGYHSKTFYIGSQRTFQVQLDPSENIIQDVVVTGIYSRPKESFTGSATTYTGKDLKSVGNVNVIQSLKTLDPVFAMIENNQFGSDPNRLPDLEIRGKSSVVGLRDEIAVDPNQPLFILDGFETSLRTVMDLDMERIASITILKDAASTAIYGSKAANGVVVIETKQPLPGQLRLTYNSNYNTSFPDLSSYNLMNAEEKLQFELLAGRYNFDYWNEAAIKKWELYNSRLEEVERGVNTYWMSEPLRVGINQRQTIYAEGGDNNMRYGIGANYNGITGVMKESKRNTFSGNIDLLYRREKFQFSNKLMYNYMNSSDPLVPFSSYAAANPYYRKTNAEGQVEKWLANLDDERIVNPLWNARLNSRNLAKGNSINNNFMAEYIPSAALRFRARFGITKSTNETDNFTSPENSSFDNIDPLLRGSLTYQNNEALQYEGELTGTFGMLFKQYHRFNAVVGSRFMSSENLLNGYAAQGFSKGNYVTAAFAKSYLEGGKPIYRESISRSNSVFANAGYSFKDRYLMDLTYRLNGSSVFGSNRRYAYTWSTGLAWNIHEEAFFKDVKAVNLLKIRGSIGNPGNQNFSAYQTYTTYMFGNTSASYFGESLILDGLGNPDLRWQTTIDKNIGLDASFFQRKLNFNLDFYHKLTDPLLINIGVPGSLGIPDVLTNLGIQESQGFNGMLTYSPIQDPVNRKILSFRYNFRAEKSKIDEIGNALDKFNEHGQNISLRRYYNGSNPDALWAVRSAGIDPSTGQEIFIRKDGSYTLDYNFEDEVLVGINRPKIEGIIGSSFTYKGFSANIDFRYRYGGQAFNSALFKKVENISFGGLRSNQDKRALYDRWQRPGDLSPYKGISLTSVTPMSSRFVEDNNSITLESLRIGYEFLNEDWMKRAKLRSLRLNAYMNDLFIISTIRTERGIDYPFARTVSFSASVSF